MSISTVLVRLIAVLFFDVPIIGDMRAMYELQNRLQLDNNITVISQVTFYYL